MNKEIVTAVVRHALTAFGGAFAARYGVDGGTVEVIAGGIAAAAGLLWSILDKKRLATT